MWKDPDPDPGGTTQKGALSGQSSQELSDLKDQNEQQQLLIAQLKEMLRKEQSNVTQEKVEEYINTLSKAKAKKTRLKRDESGSTERSISSSSIDVNKKEKLNLLRQQLEENKARLAERGKNQKGIEEMVTQLKAQLNDSQQLINLAPLSLSEPKNLDYSRNSTPEELYNILLVKEKRITELINKTQKQEGTILDLQENLKEKDSVIDARTKAITLMTDSLSKKGKSTLDELDDTKEQMRKMQENFVTLESEMKARQVKLLNDLKAKNLEITELQENNSKLLEDKSEYEKIVGDYKKSQKSQEPSSSINDLQQQLYQTQAENKEYLKKISEMEKTLQECLEELNMLKNMGPCTGNTDELVALKKQLEENNKTLIKVKAQSKSKIKDLNKKIDTFKRVSDVNALVVQLQSENTKLSEKIAELEEEKGNMQLKMVESTDSVKDSTLLEEQKELENKLATKMEEVEEKDKIISLLESDIISLKEEVKTLNEKISGLSHWENVEVTSEIKSIQIEEQMENVERENKNLKVEIEEIKREKQELVDKIEELKKEKQELSTKLDNYIQENMELIDKLEKLSAEKVSSAESIEIVEGLTQQEKLELAAYQKTLDVHIEGEPIKCQDDDVAEPAAELNESVMQLSEDSTELLRKIDMFTMERKEVMSKMEALKEENSTLNLKIKEIENNRDILAETYEQLQNEKEELEMRLRSLEEERNRFANTDFEKDDSRPGLPLRLQALEEEYGRLLTENTELKRTLKGYDAQIHEKHNLDAELAKARDKIEDLETNLKSNLEDLTFYQSVVEENKTELINSANLINELQTKLSERETDIKELNHIINDLNAIVNNLQIENRKLGDFGVMEAQVSELKSALNDQIQQAQDYEEEHARNNDIIDDLNGKLVDMNKKIIETEHEIEMKEIESKKLAQDLQNKEETIKNLQRQIEEKDKKINIVVEDMKQKYLALQKQLDGNSNSLESRVTELTNKNKEQMEKMKKIAANLKKKTQAYQELEAKYSGEKEKWETEVNEKESKIISSLQKMKELDEEVEVKRRKLAEAEDKIKELMEMVDSLRQINFELQNSVTELRRKEEKLNEVSLKQELSTSLHEDFDSIPTNQESANEEKIKELELIIETNQSALIHYTERVHKLEEDIAQLVEEKEAAERKAIELNEQLNTISKNIEEKALVEEELGKRLAKVTADNEEMSRKIEDMSVENRDLSDKNKELEELNYKLKVKVKKAHEKVIQLKSLQANFEELETVNAELKNRLAILEVSQRHIQDENEELQKRSRIDYEKIETDYQTQMEELVRCKNELTVECEKLRELVKETQGREEELLAEISEYRQKMEQKEAENKERIQDLQEEVNVANFNWNDSLREIESLNKLIEGLQAELIAKVAKETVESVITEATEKINRSTIGCQAVVETKTIDCQRDREETTVGSQTDRELQPKQTIEEPNRFETVPTFHWPGDEQPIQAQDWFTTSMPVSDQNQSEQPSDWFNSSNVPQAEIIQQSLPVENTREELLNKIKALEILLYNMDKEKEEALQECVGMINELTHLVYEKVNATKTEAQPKIDSIGAVSDIESQIMSEADITDAASKKKELHDIEFEKTHVSLGEQSHPVVEEVAQPKRAYLTYQPEDKVPKLEAFGENDDGWGWGPEEAKLEEEHMYKAESIPQVQNLRAEIAQLKEKLRVLQVERENHLEEIRQLQIKSGKLIKKCKELKLKNEQLTSTPQYKKQDSGDFFDLDATIQEELKTQITQLEKKVKELTGEFEKEKLEKSNAFKRIDVLTTANERMVEMKEIQDTEVLRWKRKYEETEEKLQHHEWGSDGFNEGAKQSEENVAPTISESEKIEELQQTIKELSMDNEELQVLLDEQRQLRINAEKAKAWPDEEFLNINEKAKLLEQDLSSKIQEIQTVLQEKDAIVKEKEELQGKLNEKEKYDEELKAELSTLNYKNAELETLLADKDKLVRDLQENEKSANVQQEMSLKINELEHAMSQLRDTIARQEQLLNEKDDELKVSCDQIDNLKEQLRVQVVQLTAELKQQKGSYAQLQNESAQTNSDLQEELEQQKQRCEQLEAASIGKINDLSDELERQKLAYDQLQEQNAEKIEQLCKQLEDQKSKYSELQIENSRKISEVEELAQQLRDKQHVSVEKDTFELAQQKYQSESLLAEKEAAIAEITGKKAEMEQEIQELKRHLEEKQKEYEQVVIDADAKISRTVAELEQTWMTQVDQRGADVAESWKLHLDSVEAEFSTVQEKLKYEINELEEKCNVLVNENNELRKNVDAEIRNEVDRISALQQQINDRQHYITELNSKLIEKQKENEDLVIRLTALENETEQLKKDVTDKAAKLSGLNLIIDTTQKQFEEKREVVEEIVRILEKNTSWPLSFEKQEVLSEFQRQLNLIIEKDQEIISLNQSISELQVHISTLQQKDVEITLLQKSVDDLQQQLSTVQGKDAEIFRLNKLVEESQKQLLIVHEKDGEIFNLNKLVEDLQKELGLVREKDAEITRLRQTIEDLHQQLGSMQQNQDEVLRLNQLVENYKAQQDLSQQEISRLQQLHMNTNVTMEDYNKKLEEFQTSYITLQNSLEEKNQLIATLNQQLQYAESLKNDNNKDVERFQEEISQLNKDCTILQESLSECQQQLFAVTSDLSNKNQELENVNQQLAYSQRNFEIQEAELNKLREFLQTKDMEYTNAVENLKKTQLRELKNHYEEVIAAKDLDIEIVKSQLQESIHNSQQASESINMEMSLRQQLEEKNKQLEEKITEQSTLLDDENKQLTELRGIIEEQVMKIEELKKELFEKSRDYDSLIAEIDIGRKAITQQPTPSTNIAMTSQSESSHQEDDLSEPVSRAELDLALYMLHQRDVRCEELTVELTQLLEERDTLQLRLSNAIREKEEIRRKLTGSEEAAESSPSISAMTTPRSKSSAIFLAASGTELAAEPLETSSSIHNLESKLSELKSVGYKKDKTFVDEQQLRRMQQISIMQQHINEASKLPPEAAAKLVDASYTLSRDVQSPSKVLLNWLWGRSTPKVNDT